MVGRAGHQPQLLDDWAGVDARATGAFRNRAGDGDDASGGLGRWLSRRRLARPDRQRHPVHRGRGGEDRDGDAQDTRRLAGWRVRRGHMACVSVKFALTPQPEEILAAWQEFSGLPQTLGLPSAPEHVLRYLEAPDRPQPRYDRDAEGGMGVTLGRLRRCEVLDYRFICLSHNTVRGAAGAALLNAELAYARGLLATSG